MAVRCDSAERVGWDDGDSLTLTAACADGVERRE
jgi:hypothetical protein